MIFETENIEFKIKATDELYKEVIAFANTDGGTIYIGIDDMGNAVGLDNVDEIYTKITNGIRDAILPDVTIFVKYTLREDKVIKIAVGEGSAKPYFLKSKGIKPSGIYIRQGASSVQATYDQIRNMIKSADGDNYETARCMSQELTFKSAEKYFEECGTEFSPKKYKALGITNQSGDIFTNLAELLSDQCQHTIKIAVFSDDNKTKFIDSKEFGGSIFKQLEDSFAYLRLCNKNSAEISGLKRIEHPDYPKEAVREALLNAIVHRDYSFSGSIIINVNSKETEFISLGGLLPGLSPEDIRSGISQPRNKNLAEVFHRLHLIESYGTGIRRIYDLYKSCPVQPRIDITANSFKMILPNMNAITEISTQTSGEINHQHRAILGYIAENGKITEAEIQKLLDVKRTRAYTVSKELCDMQLIRAVGRGKNKFFVAGK